MEDKIKCPCCNREMRVSRVPRLGEELTQIECKNCHISVTARDMGKNDKSNICAAARKGCRAYGYYWQYKIDK